MRILNFTAGEKESQELPLWHNGIDGVSAMAGTWIRSPDRDSGLKIQGCQSNSGSNTIPGLGTPYATGWQKKKKKKKRQPLKFCVVFKTIKPCHTKHLVRKCSINVCRDASDHGDDIDNDNDGDQGKMRLRAGAESIHTIEMEPGSREDRQI